MKKIRDVNSNELIHCPTEQEAIALCNIISGEGYKMESGNLISPSCWYKNRELTYFRILNDKVFCGNILQRINNKKLPASDFIPKHVYEGAPLYFVVKRDDSDAWKSYIDWLNITFSVDFDGNSYNNPYYGFDGNIYCQGSLENFRRSPTFFENPQDFLDFINKKNAKNTMKKRFPFIISSEQATRIINISCSQWKEILANLWAKNIILECPIIIDEEFYLEMRKACRPDQNKLFDQIFGVDVEEKKFPKSWEELKKIEGFYLSSSSEVNPFKTKVLSIYQKNVFSTKEQAQAVMALAQLSQLKKIYRENEGGEIDWSNSKQTKYYIDFLGDGIPSPGFTHLGPKFLAFTKEETRNLFFDNFIELIIQAKPLVFGE